LVVANTLKDSYQGYIVDADGNVLCKALDKKSIARNLVKILI